MLVFLMSCKTQLNTGINNGDLIFVEAKQEGLSGAINNVTQKDKASAFDHIGLIKKENKNYYVLHAAPKGGSQKELLNDFLKSQSEGKRGIFLYRLKVDYQKAIPEAIEKAESMLGKPYNFNYILSEDSYYCSDFVERAFRTAQIFKLEPMTFKDRKTGEFNAFWKTFYSKQNIEIPEGELGCNPNGMALSEKIYRVKQLR